MPGIQAPLDINNSSDNSSLSSNENIASSRTSSSDGQNIVIFEQNQVEIMPHFTPTFPPRFSSYEPKLDELLVYFICLKFCIPTTYLAFYFRFKHLDQQIWTLYRTFNYASHQICLDCTD